VTLGHGRKVVGHGLHLMYSLFFFISYACAISQLKRHKSPGIDQISANLLINSNWNKEELHEECKQSIIIHIYMKDVKKNCSNFRDISILSARYKILSNILQSRLTPYAEEITGNLRRVIQRNRSSTDHIFCIRQILEKKWH